MVYSLCFFSTYMYSVLHTVDISLGSFMRDNSVTKRFTTLFQDLQVSAAAVGCCLSLPQLQVQGPGPHQLGQARHVHRLQHHCPGAQGKNQRMMHLVKFWIMN
jgi:hypothetical protein